MRLARDDLGSVRFPPIADIDWTLLPTSMKQAILLGLLAVAGCSSQAKVGCPALQALSHRDAAADAREALARGDYRLLMLGGFVGSVPGVTDPGKHTTRMLDGTSDTTSDACRRIAATAEAYAVKYNRAIVQAR